jgi:hypothetical protein
MFVTSPILEASIVNGTTAPFSAILGALNLNLPLDAPANVPAIVADFALKPAVLANTAVGVNKPALTAVATAEPAMAFFKNNLRSILFLLFYNE